MRQPFVKLPSPALEDVCHQFEEWRKTRTKRTPIPKALWDAAVSLVPEHSVCQVSKHLRLDFNILKARVRQRDEQSALSFIEVDAEQIFAGSECVVEMEHRDGARMRMRFRGGAQSDLLEMAKAFWSRP
jgi:hypothetical protein